MNQDYQYMVCTWCITYNHAPYILDTLHGFCSQETNFPVINVIIDDCSTDGEEDVIDSFVAKELDISDKTTARHEENDEFIMTFARHKKNKNCFFVFYYYKENHFSIKRPRPSVIEEWKEKAKYVALCEGDDYWIEPNKLQIQVDFLETHPDISYTCTRYKTYIEKTGETYLNKNDVFDSTNGLHKDYYEFTLKDAFTGSWITKTLTCLYPRRYYDSVFLRKFKYSRDVHLVYSLLSKGNGVCFGMVSSVYRLNENSTFGGKSRIEQNRQNYLVYEELYAHTKDDIIKKLAARFYIQLFKMRVDSYKYPKNRLQFYALFVFLPISKIAHLRSYINK